MNREDRDAFQTPQITLFWLNEKELVFLVTTGPAVQVSALEVQINDLVTPELTKK